jgi:23S rRNA U2552 (ribose-2'-O)-methylase RlmE/FtsJ
LREFFINVIITKPDASRKQSSEVYVICKKYRKKKKESLSSSFSISYPS